MARLSAARYGKDNVRIFKVDRNAETGTQDVAEMTVCCLLEGAIETSYTEADNSVIVPTDTIKNTIYIKARELPVNPPELFAARIGAHFVTTYPHITAANIDITTVNWTRLSIDDKPHPHSFYRDAQDTHVISARVSGGNTPEELSISITSGSKGLSVLKSTGSAFHGFINDEYTTLGETWDRILSTDIDCSWTWSTVTGLAAAEAAEAKFAASFDTVKAIILKTFAEDESASVQNTMYKMCELILEKVPEVATVRFALPNKHYFELDLSWFRGVQNTGKDAQLYVPQSNPNGLIKCEVSRD